MSPLPKSVAPVILCVGIAEDAVSALPAHVVEPGAPRQIATASALEQIDFSQPDAPRAVVSPLVGDGFDAVEVAQGLQQAGFRGRYVAVTSGTPDLSLIRQDVARQAPNVSFSVVPLDGGPPLHSV